MNELPDFSKRTINDISGRKTLTLPSPNKLEPSKFCWDDDDPEGDLCQDDEICMCHNCGRVTTSGECQECGVPLCHACFEGGGGFCREHPSEGYKPEGEAICATCGRNEGVHECEVCGLWVCTECLEDAGAQRRICPGCAGMLREDDEDPF